MWLPSEICGGRTERSETPCCHQEALAQDKIETNKLRTRRLGNTDFSFILYDLFSWTLSLLKHWQSNWNQTCILHLVHIFSIDMLMDFYQTWSQYSHQPCPFMWLDFDPNLTFVILIFFFYYLFTFLCCTLNNLFSSLLILPHEMASPVVLNVLKPSGFGGLCPLDPHWGVAPGPHQGPFTRGP